jgi:pimeloyl-ACP methyl ester carboxylesterase
MKRFGGWVLLAVLTLLLTAPHPVLAAGQRPLEQLTVTADGHPLRVWARRAARPKGAVLFVHGRTWSARPNFDLTTPSGSMSILQAFADRGYAAYAIDLRGYGETPRDATGWLGPNRAAVDVRTALDWIARREGARPALVGYSRGSQVALLTAQTYPQSLELVVLYGFPGDPDFKVPPQPAAPTILRAPTTLAAAASDFIVPGAARPEVVAAYAKAAVAADPVRTDWGHEDEFNVLDPKKITVPLLLLQGAADPVVRPAGSARLFTGLGHDSRAWVVLPGSDHAAHLEDRTHSVWIGAIVDFIESNQKNARPVIRR